MGPHLQVSPSIPALSVLSAPMCSLQAQAGFGPGPAALLCCFFSPWRLSTSSTSLYCMAWQCCGKRLAQEHILWPWWWLSCQHMPMPSCARTLVSLPALLGQMHCWGNGALSAASQAQSTVTAAAS